MLFYTNEEANLLFHIVSKIFVAKAFIGLIFSHIGKAECTFRMLEPKDAKDTIAQMFAVLAVQDSTKNYISYKCENILNARSTKLVNNFF